MIRKSKRIKVGVEGDITYRVAVKAAVESEFVLKNEFERDQGLVQPWVLGRTHSPSEVSLTDDSEATCVVCSDPSLYRKTIQQMRAEISAYCDNVRNEWRSYKNESMKALRESCKIEKPVFRYSVERRHRVIRWTKHIRVLKEDAAAMGIYGLKPAEAGLKLKTYRPSNPLKLAMNASKASIRVRCDYEKTVVYDAHIRRQVGTKLYLDRKRFQDERKRWLETYPPPVLTSDFKYVTLRRQLNKLLAKERSAFKRCYAIRRVGELDTRGLLSSLRDVGEAIRLQMSLGTSGEVKYVTVRQSADGQVSVPYGFISRRRSLLSPSSQSLISDFPGYYTGEPLPASARISYSLTSHLTPFPLGERAARLLETYKFPFRQADLDTQADAWDRAQIDLENLNVGNDELDKADFNAYRSVAELKDTRQTVNQVRDFRNFWKTLTPSTALRTAASAYLAWKFAVEPTISDVNTLMKHTRAHLLGVRRGLWQLVHTLDLFHESAVTVRKYVNVGLRLPSRKALSSGYAIADQGWVDQLNEDSSPWFHEFDIGAERPKGLPPSDENMVYGGASLPFDLYESRLALASPADVLANKPLGFTPFWVYDDQHPCCFSSWLPEVLLDAMDPSRIHNLIDTMKLPKNVWELYPLSFVVDWFMNTGDVIRSIQNIIGSHVSQFVSNSGTWISQRKPLLLAVPENTYEITQTLTGMRTLGPFQDAGGPSYFQFPYSHCVTQVRRRVNRLRFYDTQVATFLRGPKGLPDWKRVLLPQLRVRLGGGRLTSLLAMLASSIK